LSVAESIPSAGMPFWEKSVIEQVTEVFSGFGPVRLKAESYRLDVVKRCASI